MIPGPREIKINSLKARSVLPYASVCTHGYFKILNSSILRLVNAFATVDSLNYNSVRSSKEKKEKKEKRKEIFNR